MEVRDSHVAANTARAVEEAATTSGETIHAVQDTTKQIPKAAPKTSFIGSYYFCCCPYNGSKY
jgi:hypothetical protein